MSLSRQTQWFYQGPPNLKDYAKTRAPFSLHFSEAGCFFPPCVAVAEAVSVAQLLWEDAIGSCSLVSPCSGWLSASISASRGFKSAFCNYRNKLVESYSLVCYLRNILQVPDSLVLVGMLLEAQTCQVGCCEHYCSFGPQKRSSAPFPAERLKQPQAQASRMLLWARSQGRDSPSKQSSLIL